VGPRFEESGGHRKPDSRTGKIYSRIQFITYSLLPACFNEFYELFYSTGKKIIPLNIGELLTVEGSEP
jgi:hypothetical protein